MTRFFSLIVAVAVIASASLAEAGFFSNRSFRQGFREGAAAQRQADNRAFRRADDFSDGFRAGAAAQRRRDNQFRSDGRFRGNCR